MTSLDFLKQFLLVTISILENNNSFIIYIHNCFKLGSKMDLKYSILIISEKKTVN